jgi:iron(III) transport system substrate-binding protein
MAQRARGLWLRSMLLTLSALAAACAPAAPQTAAPAQPAPAASGPIDRQAVRAEGKVVGYGTLIDSQWKTLNELYEQQYGIPVENWRGINPRVLARVETEKTAGQNLVDFIGVDSHTMDALAKQGYLQKLPTDLLERVPERWRDPNGYWVLWIQLPLTIFYNTRQVSEAEAPKSLEDLLDPKWRGKIAMPDPTLNDIVTAWFYQLRQQWGDERAQRFFTGLAAQNPTMFESALTVSTNVNQGQFPLGIGYLVHVLSVGGPGGNMGYVKLDPTPASNTVFALASSPPHPQASRALADLFLSQEFFQSAADLGYPTSMPGTRSALAGVDELNMELLPDLSGNRQDEMITYLKGIFRR